MKQPITRKDLIDDMTVILAPSVLAIVAMLIWRDPAVLAVFIIVQIAVAAWAWVYYRKVDIL